MMESTEIVDSAVMLVSNVASLITAILNVRTAWILLRKSRQSSRDMHVRQQRVSSSASKSGIGIPLAIEKRSAKKASIDEIRADISVSYFDLLESLRRLRDDGVVFVDAEDDHESLLRRGNDYLHEEVLRHKQG